MNGDFQYIEDYFLLERLFEVLSSEDDDGLYKYAFDFSSILSNVGNSIRNAVGGVVKDQGEGGTARTILNILAPATFFRIHPILGILVTAGQIFGYDLYSIYQKIVGAIKPSIESGKPVSAEQVNAAAISAMPGTVSASIDLLEPLRSLEKRGILKEAAGVGDTWKSTPFVPKNSNPLIRMFSFLSLPKRSSIIVGILAWFIKTILLSAGLLIAGGAVVGLVGGGKPSLNHNAAPSNKPVQVPSSEMTAQPAPALIPKSTGAGSISYKKNPGDLWIEPLGNQQPHERILDWVMESYPDLYEYKDIILRTPSFWNSVKSVTQSWNPGELQLSIPDPYKKRDDILSQFINDVYKMVNQYRGQ